MSKKLKFQNLGSVASNVKKLRKKLKMNFINIDNEFYEF